MTGLVAPIRKVKTGEKKTSIDRPCESSMRHTQPTATIDRAREAFALTEVSVSVWSSRRKPVLCQHPAWPLHSSVLHKASQSSPSQYFHL